MESQELLEKLRDLTGAVVCVRRDSFKNCRTFKSLEDRHHWPTMQCLGHGPLPYEYVCYYKGGSKSTWDEDAVREISKK